MLLVSWEHISPCPIEGLRLRYSTPRCKICHLATLCSMPLKSRASATSVPGTGRGAIRHSSAGEFLRNVGILLRDALLLPNGPQLQKLYDSQDFAS